MQNSTPMKDEVRSTVRTEQLPMSIGNSVDNSDASRFSKNSHWTSMGTDIDSAADCEYEMPVTQEPDFHQKLMTASERLGRMQEKMDDLEAKFKEITNYLRENPSPEIEINKPLVKEWHRQLTLELRHHVAQKLAHAIFPSTSSCEDPIRKKLDVYVRKVENDIWEKANSKSEYYHLLAEKYYKINQELNERRKRRIARKL